jgi:DNA polymerase III epsilon subunit-like protein
MTTLVFDTETTGLLPKVKILNGETLPLFPYSVQFSYIIFEDETNTILKMRDFIVRLPQDITISAECSKIHGITNEISRRYGIDIECVIDDFIQDYNAVTTVVAHNLNFDLTVLEADMMRVINSNQINADKIQVYKNFIASLNTSKKLYCTMQESIELCDIKAYYKDGREYIKFPKLSELHDKLFQSVPNNLHNSMNDVIVCLRCFYKMIHKKDILLFNKELNSLYNKLLT